jgi:hypothetical protein
VGHKADFASLTRSSRQCLESLAHLLADFHHGRSASEWTVTATVTAVEAHLTKTIRTLVLASGVPDTLLGAAMLAEYGSDFDQTWDARFDWLRRGFGLAIKGTREAQDFLTVVDLRNAVVHGHMNLTELQTRKFFQLLDLKARLFRILKVQCAGRSIRLDKETPVLAIAAARTFVLMLDQTIMAACPSLTL